MASCSSTIGARFVATHPRRHPLDKEAAGVERGRRPVPSRPAARCAAVASVTRKVDSSGNVCFAGASYRVGSTFKRRQVQVTVVGDTVEVSIGNELIRSHKAKHDRTREHGALANPADDPDVPTPPNPCPRVVQLPGSECRAGTGA